MRPVLLLAFAAAALAGCGEVSGEDPTPHGDVTDVGSEVRLVAVDRADLVLYVSNQSFEDKEVRLTVAVDTVTVVDGDFAVEDQHHWVSFPLDLSPGAHEIRANADSGAELSESFRVPGDKARYAIIDHWGEDDEAELSWSFHRRPVAFG